MKPLNDLTRWHEVKGLVRTGDLVFFDGSDNSDLVELAQHVLPNGIEFFSHCNWSHVGFFDGADMILESTELSDGRSGPQYNASDDRIAQYDGCNVSVAFLSDLARRLMDIDAAMDWARSRVGVDKYSKRTILHWVLRSVGLGHVFPHLNQSHPGEEVCSELIALALQRGGLERFLGSSVNANKCSPGTLSQWPIFRKWVQVVGGTAAAKVASA